MNSSGTNLKMVIIVAAIVAVAIGPAFSLMSIADAQTDYKKIKMLSGGTINYKCSDGKTVKTKGTFEATKSGSSWKGTWKLTGEGGGGVKDGSITHAKISSGDPQPTSLTGPVKSDNLCALGAGSGSKTMSISTYCGGDDDVRTHFKEGGGSGETLAHVECT